MVVIHSTLSSAASLVSSKMLRLCVGTSWSSRFSASADLSSSASPSSSSASSSSSPLTTSSSTSEGAAPQTALHGSGATTTTTRERIGALALAEEEAGSPPPLTDALTRALSLENMSGGERMRAHLDSVRRHYARHDTDTGSAEVQVAVLTERIVRLTVHLRSNRGDKHSLRGLQLMLAARKKHLKYLHRTDRARYPRILDSLGLKPQAFSQPRYKF